MRTTIRGAARASVGAIAFGVLAATALAGCGNGTGESAGNNDAPKEILIGVPAPLTGASAAWGKQQADAAQAVADAINASGGIKELNGAKFKLLVRDTKSDPVEATKLIREFANEHVSAIVGPSGSPEVLAAKPLLKSLKLPAFTGATDLRVTEDNVDGYVFRTMVSQKFSGPATIDFVKHLVEDGTLPKITKIGIVTTSIPPGSSLAPVITELAPKELGATATLYDYDPKQIKDFTPIVAKLKADGVQLVMGYQGPVDADLFAKAIAGQDWRPEAFVFTGSPPYQDAFRQNAGDAVVGWVSSGYAPSNSDTDAFTPEFREVVKKFEAGRGLTMAGSTGSTGAQDMAVIANAIAAAKSADPVKIAEAARKLDIATLKDAPYPYLAALGGVKFDENQDNVNLVVPFIQGTKNAGAITIWPKDAADGTLQPLE